MAPTAIRIVEIVVHKLRDQRTFLGGRRSDRVPHSQLQRRGHRRLPGGAQLSPPPRPRDQRPLARPCDRAIRRSGCPQHPRRLREQGDHHARQRHSHLWITGRLGAPTGSARIESLGLPAQLVAAVDAHQRLRGPYTAAGTRGAEASFPAWCPPTPRSSGVTTSRCSRSPRSWMRSCPAPARPSLRWRFPKERTRFYAPLRTRRIANGLVELIRASLAGQRPGRSYLENVEHAEPPTWSSSPPWFAGSIPLA